MICILDIPGLSWSITGIHIKPQVWRCLEFNLPSAQFLWMSDFNLEEQLVYAGIHAPNSKEWSHLKMTC